MPIINDTNREIGEAWMPPVADDSKLHAQNEPVSTRTLLAKQFEEGGDGRVRAYLEVKRKMCSMLQKIEDLGKTAYALHQEKEADVSREREVPGKHGVRSA